MSDYWQGMDGVIEAAKRAKDRKTKGAKLGLMRALRNTLDVSNQSVPHEEGDLERDGGTSVDDGKLRGAVSYGRSADTKDYAVPQHENMTYHHDAGRGAKFLENALNSTKAQNAEIIAKATREELGT